MKTRTFIGKMLMFMALAGMAACNNVESSVDNPVQGEIDPALLEQKVPEFSQSDFEVIYNQYVWTTSTNGTWTITKLNGIVSNIISVPLKLGRVKY